jgi:hypothetical protein
MIKPELVEYIKRQLAHGHNVTTIREHLLKHNYTAELVDETLHSAAAQFGATVKKKIPFKKIAYAFIALLIFAGIAYPFFMPSNEDLAGAATEPETPAVVIEQHEQENIPETPQEEIPETEMFVEEEPVAEEEPIAEEPKITSTDEDNDHDLVSNTQEAELGTDSLNQDSDGDGYFDYNEIHDGTNPLDPASPGYVSCTKNTDCSAGVCSSAGICITCSDSDERNYKSEGITSGVHYISSKPLFTQDSCDDAITLIEMYCRDDGYLFYENINCEQEYNEGYYCDNGKCVKE